MSTRGDEDKEFAWDFAYHLGEVCLYASAEDADLKKNDAEDRSSGRKIDAVWATKPPKVEFAICEVSGPPTNDYIRIILPTK
ncbi:hypothetical protein RirG_097060 [Rhizophagus irregularis DAOM 197198w]|uniref:Uncharacterized protein n=1 Tax=Rhizophagus irregularis (strain DAOM 197198w) TaxID=1432141 RepID=A0A015L9W5_RHIIW|nr:hypothetical protein RirG_097060 [Rhizophagus irregularis DAOM 197198w]